MRGKIKDAIVDAVEKGYTVVEGVVLSPSGRPRKLVQSGKRNPVYLRFSVRTHNGESLPVPVHRLVAYQKYGEESLGEKVVVRHLDGNPLNNHESNIAIGSASDNSMDRSRSDRRSHAAKANRVHSDDLIASIRNDHKSGLGYKKLRKKYGLSLSTLSYYLSGSAKKTSYSTPL